MGWLLTSLAIGLMMSCIQSHPRQVVMIPPKVLMLNKDGEASMISLVLHLQTLLIGETKVL